MTTPEHRAPEGGRPVSEMQERIARALFERRLRQPVSDKSWEMHVGSYREPSPGWPKYSDGSDAISDVFHDALAAMKAMREPTVAMIRPGCRVSATPILTWQAMLDAEISIAEGGKDD